MISKEEFSKYKRQTLKILRKNRIYISEDEIKNIEIADFGLNKIRVFGLQTFVLIKTEKVCLKIIVLFPYQICPEHKHSRILADKQEGKEESLRILNGTLFLYKEGTPSNSSKYRIPEEKKDYFTVFSENVLEKGMKLTIEPDTWHWFQAGPNGVIIENISTKTIDEEDLFIDPNIIRIPKII